MVNRLDEEIDRLKKTPAENEVALFNGKRSLLEEIVMAQATPAIPKLLDFYFKQAGKYPTYRVTFEIRLPYKKR